MTVGHREVPPVERWLPARLGGVSWVVPAARSLRRAGAAGQGGEAGANPRCFCPPGRAARCRGRIRNLWPVDQMSCRWSGSPRQHGKVVGASVLHYNNHF